MHADKAELWAAALESGKYLQGQHKLNKQDVQLCCLGVACELAIEAGLSVVKTLCDGGYYSYDGEIAGLPSQVKDWLGTRDAMGAYDTGYLFTDNDEGKTFVEIAAIIRAKQEVL